MKVGLLVNPVAGIGGPAGLKGSDSPEIRAEATRRGYASRVQERARIALVGVKGTDVRWYTGAGQMGQSLLAELGLSPARVFGTWDPPSTAEASKGIVRQFLRSAVDLIVFAGGDGTARDIVEVVGSEIPVLGIPAGVKMRSGCFSVTPIASGAILNKVIGGSIHRYREVEILDAPESGDPGIAGSILYGYCRSPEMDSGFMQNPKSRRDDDEADRNAITLEAWTQVADRDLVVCGPGQAASGVLKRLGFSSTLLGVDIFDRERNTVDRDVDERRLFETVDRARGRGLSMALVVGVIGGQGSLFGRGNQQISSRVLRAIGFENVFVVASLAKLSRLAGSPLSIDWDDSPGEQEVASYVKIIVGSGHEVMYPVHSA